MAILTATELCLSIGDQTLLDHASLTLESGERVSLVGRNGTGKTSLIRLLAGEAHADSGTIQRQDSLRVSLLGQELPRAEELGESTTVFDYVLSGLDATHQLVRRYQEMTATELDAPGLARLQNLQQAIDDQGGWDLDGRVHSLLKEMQLPPEKALADLSGGWKRRVALAKALVSKPGLLMLDEPTNHLDLETINWLEERADAFEGAILFVTHDRAFLSRLATRILDLDRGKLTSWPGDYESFVQRRQAALEVESRANKLFDRKLEKEEAWIRQGIKARRTRNEGRVRALERMRRDYADRTEVSGTAKMAIASSGSSGKRVIELKGVSHGYEGRALFDDVSLTVLRGDRVGLIGNNGVGKTTLLNIMLGRLEPDAGSVIHGTRLEVAYFDQLKQDLDPSLNVAEVVGDGSDFVEIDGSRRHIIGYLNDFLFTAQRAKTRIDVLSGGERHRVALARLFTRPSNLLVLDEPTNDLDLETLEVLESRLIGFGGTLLLVSHDRAFLDNVITSSLVFEESGSLVRHAGGFSDWQRLGRRLAVHEEPRPELARTEPGDDAASSPAEQTGAASPASGRKRKMSYKLRRELEKLPKLIETLESEVQDLQAVIDDPGFYRQPYEKVNPILENLANAKARLDDLMSRWVDLEEMQGD